MENYIVINGKKAELTEEQLEQLGIKSEKTNYEKMFERRNKDEFYFNIGRTGKVGVTLDIKAQDDNQLFECANYCRNMEVLKQRALHETLNRLLWRASAIAGEFDNEWNVNNNHYYIYYEVDSGTSRIGYNNGNHIQGICYFPTEESAIAALENIVKPFMKEHPDFVW